MTVPYHFTPRIPSAPHSTPFSASSYKLSNAKSTRPPIHNPYDKFTQPEFDAWIGGITGALKRALGQEEESNEYNKSNALNVIHSRSQPEAYGDVDDSEFSDGAIDDSFAEIKARRAVGKGKARDPREGPGLGKGNSLQPIEIVSSDEEDAEEAAEVELSMTIPGDSDSDKSDEEEERLQSEEEYSWDRGQSSSQPLQSPDRSARRKEVVTREEYVTEQEEQEEQEGVEYEEFDEEEYDEEEEEKEGRTGPVQVACDEIIEIDADSEGELDEDELSEEDLSASPRKSRGKIKENSLEEDGRHQEEAEEVSDEEYDDDEEDEDELGTSQLLYSRSQIHHPQNDRYEDEGANMVDADADADDEIQEIQPPEHDTCTSLFVQLVDYADVYKIIAFPPKPYTSLVDNKHIELPDPWSGPRTYAEDYYSGGDVRIQAGQKVDAHDLGSLDIGPESTFDLEADKGADFEPQMEEDTSFPPRAASVERPVDIVDPWEGPQTYAEDFYSGGPVHLPQGARTTAHFIGPIDVDYVEELDTSATPQANDEQFQPLNDNTSFPDEIASDEIPVEIQDPWAGPQTYAEDHYSGGDVRTTLGVPIDPALLSGIGDVVDDIDGFLTPGALTPSQAAEEHINSIYDDDENQAEVDEEEGSILPPLTNRYVSSISRPVPDDAEFIAVNDSDDEQELTSSQAAKENDLEGGDLDLGYPLGDHIQYEHNEQEDNREVEERVSEEVDELDEDAAEPQAGLITQADADVSISNPPLEESRGEDEVQNSEQAIKSEAPSEQELSVLDAQADRQTEGYTPTLEENRGVNTPAVISGFEVVPETVSEERPTTKSGVEAETQIETTFERTPTEDAIVTVIDERVIKDDESGSESRQGHMVIEEISTHFGNPMAAEPAETATSGNTVATEIDEIPTEGDNTSASGDVDIPETYEDSMEISVVDEEIPMTIVGNTAESDEDHIRSTPSLEDEDDPPASALPTAFDSIQTHGQLPTPPSEKGRYVSLPPDMEDTIPKRKDSETPDPANNIVRKEAPGLNIPESIDEGTFMDEDADGEVDDESDLDYIEVKTVGSEEEFINDEAYIVEETRTEGRSTVEPSDRGMSLDVVSVGYEGAVDDHNNEGTRLGDDHMPLSTEHVSPTALEAAREAVSEQSMDKKGVSFIAEVDQGQDSEDVAEIASASGCLPTQFDIPIPVTADSDVLDPTHPTDDGSQVAGTTSGSDALHTKSEVSTPVTANANVLEQPASSIATLPTQPDVSMPASANEDVIELTDRPLASPPSSRPSDVLNTSGIVSSHLLTPRSAGEPIPVSIPVHSSTLRAMTQLNENLATGSPDNSTQVDGLFTPAEAVTKSTEQELESRRILTEMAQYVFGTGTSSALFSSTLEKSQDSGSTAAPSHGSRLPSLPEIPTSQRLSRLPSATGDNEFSADVFGQVSSTDLPEGDVSDTVHNTPLPDGTSLRYRAPSVSMRVTLSRKPTDPVLMADPYPYCLSTPGPSNYPGQDEASEEEIGFDNSQSSISTVEKETEDKDASSIVDDGEGLGFQYPPDAALVSRQETAPAQLKEDETRTINLVQGQIEDSAISYTGKDSIAPPSSSSITSTVTPLAAEGSTTKRKRDPYPDPYKPSSAVKTQKGKGRKGTKGEHKGKFQAIKNLIPEPTSEETILVKPRQAGKIAKPTNRATSITSIQESQASSGASAAYQILQSGSRSSSVSSAIPDNRSVVSQPSPTVNKPNALPPTVNLESLFHAHGQKKKALALTTQQSFSPRAQSKKPQLSRFPSTSTVPDQPSPTSSTAALSPVVPSTKPDTPTAKTTTTPSRSNFTTPVTRSHCRYHRISLPKEEGGTRVNFLVPGCSLNDRELMDEEEIVDHGDATVDDSRNMLKDIENLGFSLDLIGVIRQLVGLDILREQEVFYLPQPGEVVTWKKAPLQKSVSERAAMVRAPGEASSHAGSPGGYSGTGIAVSVSNRRPRSFSSYSSTPSIDTTLIRGSAPSFKPEQSDDEEPAAKRPRPSPEEQAVMGPPGSQSKGKPSLKNRRNKKIDLTYEPGEEEQDEESDHENLTSSRKRRKSTRGVKRSRTSEVVPTTGGNDEERETKKLKSDSITPPESEPQSEHLFALTAMEHPAT